MNPARCGTPSGYVAHHNRGEEACRACKTAKRDYARDLVRRKAQLRFGYAPPPKPSVEEGYRPPPIDWPPPKLAKPNRSLHMTLDGREFTTDLDSEDLAPRAQPDQLDAQWKARVRREVYGG